MDDVSLGRGIDLGGVTPDEAFATLGNETRLDVLRVLWGAVVGEATDGGSPVLTYTELRHGVGLDDSGQFNYHLSKLTPHFVRETDDGYRLTRAGERIARSVTTASDALADLGFPRELDTDCPFCGSTPVATYEDQQLGIRCTECPGMFGDQAPSGTLAVLGFPTAGRGPEEVVETTFYKCQLDLTYMMHGVCRECGGPVSPSVSVCGEHDVGDGEPCEACRSPFEVWVEQRCDRCHFGKTLPVELYVTGLAPVIGFLYDNDVDILEPTFEEFAACLRDWFETSVANDPLRLTVSVKPGSDELTLVLDDEMTVIDEERRSSETGVTT